MPEIVLNNIEEIWKEFQDATKDNPVNADEFLSALNLDFLHIFFKKLYRRKPDYPAEAMLKAVFFNEPEEDEILPGAGTISYK